MSSLPGPLCSAAPAPVYAAPVVSPLQAVYYLDRCLEAAPNCVQFQTMKAESLALSKRYDDAHYIAKCVPQVSSVMCITLL